MKEKLQQRLQSLKAEYEVGQKMLVELEAKQTNLRETLLRISGAIQIIEETLGEATETVENNTHPPEEVSAEVLKSE
ncbi:MAG: hypothetical protein F6K58_14805 [Symploca sp. SIO2E9]|nr:hypothetical protein [Symploca sp. SIO2E9]